MVLTSFMTASEINRFPPKFLPSGLHVDGYVTLLAESHIVRWFANTVLVSAIAVTAHLILCSLARLRLRPAEVRRPRRRVPGDHRDRDDPYPAADDPHVPDVRPG
nr:hypothetical protein GCM10020092_041880 [Actinoplanes digitatis]